MDVKVIGGGDGGMPEDGAHRLAVTSALYASGGEAVAHAVELHVWNAKPLKEADVVVAVDARVYRHGGVAEDEMFRRGLFHHRPESFDYEARQRHFPLRGQRFGAAHREPGRPPLRVVKP